MALDGYGIGGAVAAGGEPFVGRLWERRELAAAVERGCRGHGELVVVVGDPGMGKTRLVGEAVAALQNQHSVVTWVGCSDATEVPGFWPWAQVARAVWPILEADSALPVRIDRRALGVVAAELGDGVGFPVGTDPVEIRSRILAALGALLAAVSRTCPQVVVIDDLQWADLPSVLMLRQLTPALRTCAVTVICTFRGSEVYADGRRELFRALAAGGRRVELGGLSRADIEVMVEAMTGGAKSSGWADTLHERTGGNPFFAKEVVRLDLAQATGPGRLAGLAVPPTVGEVIERRVARLPDAVSGLLAAAAVLGERFSVADLTGLRPAGEAVLDGLDIAVNAGLARQLDNGGVRFGFAHALVREALYEGMGTRQRAQLHQRAGQALQAAGATAEVLAHHFLAAAAVVGVDVATGYAIDAGEQGLRRFAHEDAATWFARALALNPGDDRALLGRAEARRQGGDQAGARADLDAVLTSCRATPRPELFARAALGVHRLGFESGHAHSEPVGLLRDALAGLAADADPELRAAVLSALAHELHNHASNPAQEARVLASDALELAERRCAPATVARCLEAQFAVWWAPGLASRRADIAARMIDVARIAGDDEARAVAHLLHATALLELGDTGWVESLDRFLTLADRLRLPRLDYLALTRRSGLSITRGDLDAARRYRADAAELGARIGEPDTAHVQFHLDWELARLTGQRRELLDHPLPEPQTVHVQLYGRVWRPLILLDADRPQEAGRALADAATVPLDQVRRDWIFLHNLADLGEAAVRLGDHDLAERCRAALSPYAGTMVVASAAVVFAGAVDHHLGVLALGMGDPAAAVEHLRVALATHERLGARPWAEASRALLEQATTAVQNTKTTGTVVREGRVWRLSFDGRDAHVPDAKGVHDLTTLLARPGTDVHATELYAAGSRTLHAAAADQGDPALDAAATRAYRAALARIDRELADADTDHDHATTQRLVLERDALIEQLRRAFDLHGRPRRLGEGSERARKAVSARIRDAITLIEQGHPSLGAHLRGAVRTGTFCGYHPPTPTRWHIRQI